MNGTVPPRAPRHALLALVALAAGSASAQAPAPATPRPTPPMAAPAAPVVFAIPGFRIEGENPIGEAEAQRVLAPYVRPDATMETLQQATKALETELSARGYGLHRVALPPQEVGATVRLDIVKFVIGKVAIEGARIYDEGNIRRTLPELREGESPNFRKLAIQTAIANENPNKQVQVGLRESEEPDRIDATITVKEERPWTAGVAVSNTGPESTGRDRLILTAGHTNLWNLDHQFVAAYTTSVERTEDVKQFGLTYKIPMYAWGGVIGATYTRSDVVGDFGGFRSTGAGHTTSVAYTQYLPPKGGRRSYVSIGLDDKLFEKALIDGIPIQEDRRSRPVVFGYTARTETDTEIWGYSVEFAANTVTGSHNNLSSYRTEDPRIDTAAWNAFRAVGSATTGIFTDWLLNTRAAFQYSPDVLIAGEQFGIGGLGSVRGTDADRPVTGDSGFSTSVELMTPEPTPGLRFLVFADAGYVRNNKPDDVQNPAWDRLASWGLGLRFVRGKLVATADYGKLFRGSRVPLALNSGSPQKGDDRLYVTLGIRF
ncbi:ShlB/FhaC/HecB family hemolysin secretion/activation protein [Ramlibacter sp. USB13]|uniref:ShlB/FhaC/HecB family hemolysin secretion/activation protein n=1 Tax=Ramlibacter cellulosilyticus TaxID=2764187 RepID=A0A923MNL9_9BURK|nr:ShlB/FhaC/HecB family hemolysin secretion/activation protein [Ramlibacter cellulosilyticus]MBC5781739.1 ShlB/FhaC/HecB family hemolysin secretion/activation protein [Ramlibacter cellulosilyticus]